MKSKSRSKSPRPRSPPLTTGSRMNTVGASGVNKQHDSWSLRKFNADLLTQHPPEDEGGGGKDIVSVQEVEALVRWIAEGQRMLI